SLGYASWLSRNDPFLQNWKKNEFSITEKYPAWKELGIVLTTGLLIFWLIPATIEMFTKTAIDNNMPGGTIRNEIARMADNYAITGFIFILVLMRFPRVAWQLGITLTFCHAAIDLVRDFYPGAN